MTQIPALQYEQKPFADDRGGKFDDLISSFHSARAEIATLFALAGLDPTKTRESARELGLNRGLTWRLTRVVRESNPTLVVSDVPGSQSMAKFFDACRQRGAPETAIETAVAALNRFEEALSSCSGDRKTLAMLMANREDAASAVEREKARRSLFEGACGVWGVQAQTRFVSVFVFPCPEDPNWLDVGHVNGFVGFRRLRPGAITLSHEAVHKATGEVTTFTKEPLDAEDPANRPVRLLRSFCSPSTLDIRIVPSGDYNRFELAPGPVGNEGALDVRVRHADAPAVPAVLSGTRHRRLHGAPVDARRAGDLRHVSAQGPGDERAAAGATAGQAELPAPEHRERVLQAGAADRGNARAVAAGDSGCDVPAHPVVPADGARRDRPDRASDRELHRLAVRNDLPAGLDDAEPPVRDRRRRLGRELRLPLGASVARIGSCVH
jgi:hypothetical protein